MIEMKNEAESLMYNTEKQLKENDAKIPQDIKDKIRNDINQVNEAISSNNNETLKKAIEALSNSAMEMGRSIYSQSGATGGEQSAQQGGTDTQGGGDQNKQ
jgi:molecular chaperone DnaK (HSP70)